MEEHVNRVFKNTGDKLSRQLLSLVDFSKGRNYQSTHINVRVYKDRITVSTFYIDNDTLNSWDNDNYTTIEKAHVPYFTAKKLGLLQ
jgi:hypothetical protein